jgi:hypothetical protein
MNDKDLMTLIDVDCMVIPSFIKYYGVFTGADNEICSITYGCINVMDDITYWNNLLDTKYFKDRPKLTFYIQYHLGLIEYPEIKERLKRRKELRKEHGISYYKNVIICHCNLQPLFCRCYTRV